MLICFLQLNFLRLRIGIGKNENMDLADYVLSKINSENMSVLQEVILQAVDYIENQFLKEKKKVNNAISNFSKVK